VRTSGSATESRCRRPAWSSSIACSRPDVSRNYRWVLHSDGRLFCPQLARRRRQRRRLRHRAAGDTDDDLPPATVAEVERRLRAVGFARQAPYQANPRVQDGSWYIVTARLDGQVHEVVYDAFYPPLITYLDALAPA
jgi:hypothetical protein